MQFEDGLQTQLIEMYEAREAILNRINPDAVSVIDIDKFLQAAVTEVGQRLAVDRCNIITPSANGGLRVSHEYLGDEALTPGLGLNIPTTLVPFDTIKQYLPKARHFSIDDTDSPNLPLWVRTTCKLIHTRSVLVAPFVFREELLGVMGLHYCNAPHRWTEAEIKLVGWLASQVSVALQYTR
jgi:GAF domain-containing protein